MFTFPRVVDEGMDGFPGGGGGGLSTSPAYSTTKLSPTGATTKSGGGYMPTQQGNPDLNGLMKYLMAQKAQQQKEAAKEAALRRKMLLAELDSRRQPAASPASHGGGGASNADGGDYLWTTYPTGPGIVGGPQTSTNYTSGAVSGGRLPAGAKMASGSSFGGMIPNSKAGLDPSTGVGPGAANPSQQRSRIDDWYDLPDYLRVKQMAAPVGSRSGGWF